MMLELVKFSLADGGRKTDRDMLTHWKSACAIYTLIYFIMKQHSFRRSITQAQKRWSDYNPKHQKHRKTYKEQSKADLFHRSDAFISAKKPLMVNNSSGAILIAVVSSSIRNASLVILHAVRIRKRYHAYATYNFSAE